jgi:hypothetical protein
MVSVEKTPQFGGWSALFFGQSPKNTHEDAIEPPNMWFAPF